MILVFTLSSTLFKISTPLSSLQGHDIADYGYQLGRFWGIGQKDTNNGVLLIIAPNQRKVRIEVGYGLEGALTDVLSNDIIQYAILPHFRDGDYATGIVVGTESILDAIVGEYSVHTVNVNQSTANPFKNRSYTPNWEEIKFLLWMVFIIWIFLGTLKRHKTISTKTVCEVLYVIIPMHLSIWLFSASLGMACLITSFFSCFFVLPWLGKLATTKTMIISLITNAIIFLFLWLVFNTSTELAVFSMLAISTLIIFPISLGLRPNFRSHSGSQRYLTRRQRQHMRRNKTNIKKTIYRTLSIVVLLLMGTWLFSVYHDFLSSLHHHIALLIGNFFASKDVQTAIIYLVMALPILLCIVGLFDE